MLVQKNWTNLLQLCHSQQPKLHDRGCKDCIGGPRKRPLGKIGNCMRKHQYQQQWVLKF